MKLSGALSTKDVSPGAALNARARGDPAGAECHVDDGPDGSAITSCPNAYALWRRRDGERFGRDDAELADVDAGQCANVAIFDRAQIHERIDEPERAASAVERMVLDAAGGDEQRAIAAFEQRRAEERAVIPDRRGVGSRDAVGFVAKDADRVGHGAGHSQKVSGEGHFDRTRWHRQSLRRLFAARPRELAGMLVDGIHTVVESGHRASADGGEPRAIERSRALQLSLGDAQRNQLGPRLGADPERAVFVDRERGRSGKRNAAVELVQVVVEQDDFARLGQQEREAAAFELDDPRWVWPEQRPRVRRCARVELCAVAVLFCALHGKRYQLCEAALCRNQRCCRRWLGAADETRKSEQARARRAAFHQPPPLALAAAVVVVAAVAVGLALGADDALALASGLALVWSPQPNEIIEIRAAPRVSLSFIGAPC